MYSFSVVKSGKLIRHNYSLHLLWGKISFLALGGPCWAYSTSNTMPPSFAALQTHALKKGQQFHNNVKTATGEQSPMTSAHPTRMPRYFYPPSRTYWRNTELLLWLNVAKNLTSVNVWKSVTNWMVSASKLLFFLSLKIILDTRV